MEEELKQFLEKIEKLVDLKKCDDSNYTRNPTNKKLVKKIYEEQKGKCWLCKCKTNVPLTHHIQPEGKSSRENLVIICPLCHQFIHWILKKYLGYRGTAGHFPRN